MKILFLPNWTVKSLVVDDPAIQAPNKYIKGEPYWFLRYFKDCDVDIIDKQESFFLHFFESKILKNYFYQCLKAFLKRNKYDVVISHGAQSGLFYALLSTLFGGKKPLHLIIDIGGMNGARINKYETPLIRFALKSKPSIVYHSEPQIDLYKKAYPELLPFSKFIKFGVDNEYFVPCDLEEENYILTFGFYKRDNATLIKAWEQVDKGDCKLYILGVNGESNEHITYYDKVSLEVLKEKIAKCLFVVIPLPVYNYSYGQMSFLQSMAMGKTVIVTETPSSIGYFEDQQGAFYVRPYDTDDMKNKIISLLSAKSDLKALGLQARRQVDSRLNEKLMANQIFEFIVQQILMKNKTFNH